MHILQDNLDLPKRKLAEMVSRLNYCLNALIDKCFVNMGNLQKSKNKVKHAHLPPRVLPKRWRLGH